MRFIARVLMMASVTGVLLTGSGLAVAAQGGGACPLVSDAALGQALGPKAKGEGRPGAGDSVSLCTVTGVTDAPIAVTRLANVFISGDTISPDQLQQFSPQSAAMAVQGTPISDVGDSALLMTGQVGAGRTATLLVQSGTDMYTFAVANPPPNGPDVLTALAQAVLANAAE